MMLLASLVIVGLILTPSGAFTSANVPRSAGVDGVSDENGIVGFGVASQVNTSSTEQLVNVTNNRTSSITVTISLDSASTDIGDLVVDGVNEGNSATFSLAGGGVQTVEISVPADCSLGGRTVVFDVKAVAPSFELTAERSSSVSAKGGHATRKHVVYERASDSALTVIDRSGAVTSLGVATDGFGPPEDFDEDCDNDFAYVDAGGGITMIDAGGASEQLVASGVQTGSRLGVGDWDGDGTYAVFYANANDRNQLYRKEYGGTASVIAASPTQVHSIAGIADFNGDGDLDVVFTKGNAQLHYVDDGGSNMVGVKANCASCVGTPRDFDGDGTVRVPFVSGNGNVELVDAAGNTQTVWSSAIDEPTGSLGSFDWNEDGSDDVVMVKKLDTTLYWVDVSTGSATQITDGGGSAVSTNLEGVA